MKIREMAVMIVMLICLVACAGPSDLSEGQPEMSEVVPSATQEKKPEAETSSALAEPVKAEEIQKSVVIAAVVKEITQEGILISSKSDSFPGAFQVRIPPELPDGKDLAGGEQIRITMKELAETDTDRRPCYEALMIMEDPGLAEEREDILQTDVPQIRRWFRNGK